MDELELHQYGDVELWYIKGTIPEGDWSLPLHIYRYRCEGKEFVRIQPILALPAQSIKIKELFDGQAIWKENGQYLVATDYFESVAHKAPGITPDCYRLWPGIEPKVPKSYQLEVQSTDEAEEPEPTSRFLDHAAKVTGVSRKLLKIAWWAMAEAAPNWLITHHKPLDLGWATIYPVPYRTNWKEVVIEQDPSCAPYFRLPQEERDKELENAGFIGRLCQGHNMGINPTRTIQWTFELVPSKTTNEMAERQEVAQLQLGMTRYVARYEKLIAKLLPSILTVFAAWLRSVSLPYGRVRSGRSEGVRRLVPFKGNFRGRTSRLAARIVLPFKRISFPTEGDAPAIPITSASLPAMPDIPPAADDVRKHGGQNGDMDAPANWGL